MSGEIVDLVSYRKPFEEIISPDDISMRHAATIRCKRTGQVWQHFAVSLPADRPSIGIEDLSVTIEWPYDDDNIIDPYGSGPVPIEPVTVKIPSRTVDGVKTGLVVGR